MSIIKNTTTSVRNHWRLAFSLLFFVASGIAITIFAAPPTTPYTQGETLDPSCIPGATNCTVGILESRDEGTNLTYQTKSLDFVGAGVVATESGGVVTVTVSGGISSAITSLNGLTGATQTFATGTSGSDFNISSTTSTHTFNIPDASASARGLVTTDTQTFAGTKTFGALVATTFNGNTFTTGTGILTLGAGKTLTASNTLTFTGTDGSTLNVGTGGTLGTNAFTSTAYAPIASPTFTGTVTIPTSFVLGATTVTTTGTQLNYLNGATGTTGTTSTNVVFSGSPSISSLTLTGTSPLTMTQTADSSGSPAGLLFTGAAHTTLTASTEATDVNFNLARTVQFATGALTTQRAFRIQAPTYAFVGASTITDAATFAVTGAPIKSTNATITSSHGILVQAGAVSTATAAYGLTVNAPTGATTNIAAQFLDAATMSGTETFYPAADFLRAGSEGVKVGIWSRASGTAEGGAVLSRSANALILGTHSSLGGTTPQRILSLTYGANNPSMYFGTTSAPNSPYDFAMNGAIAFRVVPNSTKWGSSIASGIISDGNGPVVYGASVVSGTASFGDLVLSARNNGTAIGMYTGTTTVAQRMKIDGTGNTTFTQGIATTGSPVALTLTGAAHTTLTASTEATDVNFNLARTVQFATGALTTQRAFRIQAPTYAFVGASTITDAATLVVSGAPVAGTNATITNSYAIWAAAGTIRFDNLASCAGIQTNGSGVLSCTSDENLKDVQSPYTRGLDAIRGIAPQTYTWKTNSYLNDGGVHYSGVIAQNIEQFIPEAVNTGAMGYKQVSQMTLIVTSINAIKELDLKIIPLTDLSTDTPQSFGSLTKQFLENANNTLQEVFFGKVHTKELCLDDVCITKDQLQQLLNNQNMQSTPNGGSGNSGGGSGVTDDTTPPGEESAGGNDSAPPPAEESVPPVDSGTPPPTDVPATSE